MSTSSSIWSGPGSIVLQEIDERKDQIDTSEVSLALPRKSLLVNLLMVLLSAIIGLHVLNRLVAYEEVPLRYNSTLELDLTNCDAKFVYGSTAPRVKLKGWLIYLNRNRRRNGHWFEINNDSVKLNFDLYYNSKFLPSEVIVTIPQDFQFRSLNVRYKPDGLMKFDSSAVALRAHDYIRIEAFNAQITIADVEAPVVSFDLIHGYIDIQVGSAPSILDRNETNLSISSLSAPVFVQSLAAQTEIRLSEESLARSTLLRSSGEMMLTEEDGLKAVLSNAQSAKQTADRVSVNVKSVNCPLYILSSRHEDSEDTTWFQTWAGSDQKTVEFNEVSKASLDKYIQKMKLTSDSWSDNLVLEVIVDREGYGEEDRWFLTSSETYLMKNWWFSLTNAGSLMPEFVKVHIHLTSLFCTESDVLQNSGPFPNFETAGARASEFSHHKKGSKEWEAWGSNIGHTTMRCPRTLWVREFSKLYRTMTDMSPKIILDAREETAYNQIGMMDRGLYLFSVDRDNVLIRKLTDAPRGFIACCVINFLISLGLALWFTNKFDQLVHSQLVNNQARLFADDTVRLCENLKSPSDFVDIKCVRYDQNELPCVRIIWSEEITGWSRLLVAFMDLRTGEAIPITIEDPAMVNLLLTEGGTQRYEIIVPIKAVNHKACIKQTSEGDEKIILSQGIHMEFNDAYRVRILWEADKGLPIRESDWSNVIRLVDAWRYNSLAVRCLNHLFTSPTNSLSVFLHYYTLMVPPCPPLEFAHFKLIPLADSLSRQSYVCEIYFGTDNIVAKTVSRYGNGLRPITTVTLQEDTLQATAKVTLMPYSSDTRLTFELRSKEGGKLISSGMIDAREVAVKQLMSRLVKMDGKSFLDSLPNWQKNLWVQLAISMVNKDGAKVADLICTHNVSFLTPFIVDYHGSDHCHFLGVQPAQDIFEGSKLNIEIAVPCDEQIIVNVMCEGSIIETCPIESVLNRIVKATWTARCDWWWSCESKRICFEACSANDKRVLATSPTCVLHKLMTLQHLEYAYAVFCRSTEQEMLPLTKESLAYYGIAVDQRKLKICRGLRHRLPFEAGSRFKPYILADGHYIVRSDSVKIQSSFSPASFDLLKSTCEIIPVVPYMRFRTMDPYTWTAAPVLQVVLRHSSSLLAVWFKSNEKLAQVLQQLNKTDKKKLVEGTWYMLPLSTEYNRRAVFKAFEYWSYALQNARVSLNAWCNYMLDICECLTLVYLAFYIEKSEFVSHLVFQDARWRRFPLFLQLAFAAAIASSAVDLLHELPISKLNKGRTWHLIWHFCKYSRLIRLAAFLLILCGYLIWQLISILCWTEQNFPLLVAVGASGFLVYSINESYNKSSILVQAFTKEHLNGLLQVALDNWLTKYHQELTRFEPTVTVIAQAVTRTTASSVLQHNLPPTVASHVSDVSHILQLARVPTKIPLSPWERWTVKTTAQKRQRLILGNKIQRWNHTIWVCPDEDPMIVKKSSEKTFVVSGGPLHNLPFMAKLVTAKEISNSDSRHMINPQEILSIYRDLQLKCPLLIDSGYITVDQNKLRMNHFSKTITPPPFVAALICLPVFPSCDELPFNEKVKMIFTLFDRKQIGRWQQQEFEAWCTKTKKPTLAHGGWTSILNRFKMLYGITIHPVMGATVQDLEEYYRVVNVLNHDYQVAFNVQQQTNEGAAKNAVKEALAPIDATSADTLLPETLKGPTPEEDRSVSVNRDQIKRKLERIFRYITTSRRRSVYEELCLHYEHLQTELLRIQQQMVGHVFRRAEQALEDAHTDDNVISGIVELQSTRFVGACYTGILEQTNRWSITYQEQLQAARANLDDNLTKFYDIEWPELINRIAEGLVSTASIVNYSASTAEDLKAKSDLVNSHMILACLEKWRQPLEAEFNLKGGAFELHTLMKAFILTSVLEASDIQHKAVRAVEELAKMPLEAFEPQDSQLATFLAETIATVRHGQQTTFQDITKTFEHLISSHLTREAYLFFLQLVGLRISESGNQTRRRKHSIWRSPDRTSVPISLAMTVFREAAGNSGFLPLTRAATAIDKLLDGCLPKAAIPLCLHHLGLDLSIPFPQNSTLDDCVQHIMLKYARTADGDREIYELDIEAPFKSSHLGECSVDLTHSQLLNYSDSYQDYLNYISSSSSIGCLSKSDVLNVAIFTLDTALKCAQEDAVRRFKGVKAAPGTTLDCVSLEQLHRILTEHGFSESYLHTSTLWLLCCRQISGTLEHVLPVSLVFEIFMHMILRLTLPNGTLWDWTVSTLSVEASTGSLTKYSFKSVMQELNLGLPDIDRLWDALPKTSLLITELDPERIVRVLSPQFVDAQWFYKEFPHVLQSGTFPRAIQYLAESSLQDIGIGDIRIQSMDAVTEVIEDSAYTSSGLVKRESLAEILSSLYVKGMTEAELEKCLEDMELNIPPKLTRLMFVSMDINNDRSLDLGEVLDGFQLLFSTLIPDLLLNAVGVTMQNKIVSIAKALFVLFGAFCFVGLSSSAFAPAATESLGSNSNTMQTILAVAGAATLQASNAQDPEQVKKEMLAKMRRIMGPRFDTLLDKAKQATAGDKDQWGLGSF